MAETTVQRLVHRKMDEHDWVKHLYSRRVFWGSETLLYRRNHPMLWKRVNGNYQNWEVDTSGIVPTDAETAYGEAVKLFFSEDMGVWLSRRRETMPYFYRNCDADELHLVSRGEMTYETDFGEVEVGEREFLVIPKGVTYRVVFKRATESLRIIYESGPEVFVVPKEMVDHIYGKGRGAVREEKLRRAKLGKGNGERGEYEVRVKYRGAFSDFLGEESRLYYDFHPLDVEMVDGEVPVFKFGVGEIEKLGSTPVPFLGGAYLDNKKNLAWTLHLSGGGVGTAPVHRDADVDELRYVCSGSKLGNFLFTPQGVDHGGGRGYTKREKNRSADVYDVDDNISAYTIRPLKGTPAAYRVARPYPA